MIQGESCLAVAHPLKAERGPVYVGALADLYRAFSRTEGYGVR